jgi:hypothetical protein
MYQRPLLYRFLLLALAFLSYSAVKAQQSDTPDRVYQDAYEQAAQSQNSESDRPFDFSAELEPLQMLVLRPLDLNRVSRAELDVLTPLSAAQRDDIIAHRNQYGNYRLLEELQTIPSLSDGLIRQILPFVTLDPIRAQDETAPFAQWWRAGQSEILTRLTRRFERAKGFTERAASPYMGDPNALLVRFRYRYNDRLSYGITAEKDAGEPWQAPQKTTGFDFYSAHLMLRPTSGRLKMLCLGDYEIRFGQGLIQWNGFALGKSSLVLNVERAAPSLRAYTATAEMNFQRGAAAQFQLNRHTQALIFASHRLRDANLLTLNRDTAFAVSSLLSSGYHRTNAELADKNTLQQSTVGVQIRRQFRGLLLGVQGIFHHFDKKIEPADELYNRYAFRGTDLLNLSADYAFDRRNLHFFGETAYGNTGGIATLNGLLVALDKRFKISILQRYFSRGFHAFGAAPFAESSRSDDENGLYVGLEFQPSRSWLVQAYTDTWRNQWWRYGVDAANVGGNEWFLKTSWRRKASEAYLQLRIKTKAENEPRPDAAKVNQVSERTRTQIRAELRHQFNRYSTVTTRGEWTQSTFMGQARIGQMLYVELQAQLPSRHLKLTTRMALFDTDDYNAAIYVYENDVLHSFSITPLYYRGVRNYFLASWQLNAHWLLEARWAQSIWNNRTSIGSGNDEIAPAQRTDLKVQARWQF